jgi:hypothetical protein
MYSEEIEPVWVVNSLGELGVRVRGRHYFLYKGESLDYSTVSTIKDGVVQLDSGEPMMVRMVGKIEFGEVCKPVVHLRVENGHIYDRTPKPYTLELTYVPGLSFGTPEDAAWKPLPANRPSERPSEKPEITYGVVEQRALEVESMKERYLRDRRWKHTCKAPGSRWVWVKEQENSIDLPVLTAWTLDEAWSIQSSLED